MSTRGICGVHIDGKDKLIYNHSDSYPRGLGLDILNFCRKLGDDEVRLSQARVLILVDHDQEPTDSQIEQLLPYTDLSVSHHSTKDWYCLTRNLQGDIGATLEAGYAVDGRTFIRDSLFCEWAYVINFDTGKLEVYKGFQKISHDKGRFAFEVKTAEYRGDQQYYPCALVAEFPFNALPDDESFVNTVQPPEDD